MEVITSHVNADFDALASMVAAKKLYPDAVLAFPGSQEKSMRDFLLTSTMYMLDVQKASKVELGKIKKLILVDIRQESRIGKFASVCRRKGVEIHIYDHHPPSPDDIVGDFEIIKNYGSTTAIMCEILKQKRVDISPEEATALMLGIYEDTGNLTFSSTTPEDFKAAAFLLSQGANLNIVADMVVKELTAEQVSLLNELVENSVTASVHGINVMISKVVSDTYIADFAVLVHKLKNMENANVLFAIADMDDRIYLVGRSRIEQVNVGEVVSWFGGGGHATAASATISDLTMIQVEQKLLEILHSHIKPVKTAKDFMATPVKTIDKNETIETAGSLLTRYNINVLPVVDRNRLSGLISRQIIEKARYHGLVDIAVKEYMTTEYATVNLNTPLSEIKKHIINDNQRFLPVVDGKKIKGAITRTDLLRVLHLDSEEIVELTETETKTPQMRRKKLRSILVERLPEKTLNLLRDIGKVAEGMGYNAYAVGGFVRDIFLGFDNFDLDIVIEGDGINFAKVFAEKKDVEVKIYKKFGTAVIILDEGIKIDIASSRLEYYEKPAALPKVEWSSIKLDLYRRDFTINTLALRLNRDYFGELIDYFGARRDMKEKVIRVLHNLSFVEDPSRIFRAVRFEQRFGFRLGKLTKKLIENAIRMDFLFNISGKRVFSEIILLLSEETVLSVIQRLSELGMLRYIHPGIKYDNALKQRIKAIQEVLMWYDLLYTDKVYDKWFVYFLSLIEGLKDDNTAGMCRYFDMKKKFVYQIEIARTTGSQVLYKMAQKKTLKNSEIYRLLSPLPVEVSLYLMAKTSRKATRKAFSLYFTQLQQKKISVSGMDLKKLGIMPGRVYRFILDTLHDAVINEEVSGKEEEIRFVKERFVDNKGE